VGWWVGGLVGWWVGGFEFVVRSFRVNIDSFLSFKVPLAPSGLGQVAVHLTCTEVGYTKFCHTTFTTTTTTNTTTTNTTTTTTITNIPWRATALLTSEQSVPQSMPLETTKSVGTSASVHVATLQKLYLGMHVRG